MFYKALQNCPWAKVSSTGLSLDSQGPSCRASSGPCLGLALQGFLWPPAALEAVSCPGGAAGGSWLPKPSPEGKRVGTHVQF